MARCTVRSDLLHLTASFLIEGQHSPSSSAQSARANNTSLSLSHRVAAQAAVMTRMLTSCACHFGRL